MIGDGGAPPDPPISSIIPKQWYGFRSSCSRCHPRRPCRREETVGRRGKRTGKRRIVEQVPSEPTGVLRLLSEVPVGRLDLHGLNGMQAERRVRDFVTTRARIHPGGVVEIITGKGTGSEGAPVLPGVTRDVLEYDVAECVAETAGIPGGGGVRVRLAR